MAKKNLKKIEIFLGLKIFYFYSMQKLNLKEPYSSYGKLCSSKKLCKGSVGLICLTSASECNCPYTLTANHCDCQRTHYWDMSSLSCQVRSSEGEKCSDENDFMCKFYFFILVIFKGKYYLLNF